MKRSLKIERSSGISILSRIKLQFMIKNLAISKLSKHKTDVILLSDVAKRLLTFAILRNSTYQTDSSVKYVYSIEYSYDAATLKDGPLWPQSIPILTSFRLVYSLHKTSSLLQIRKEIPFELISKNNNATIEIFPLPSSRTLPASSNRSKRRSKTSDKRYNQQKSHAQQSETSPSKSEQELPKNRRRKISSADQRTFKQQVYKKSERVKNPCNYST